MQERRHSRDSRGPSTLSKKKEKKEMRIYSLPSRGKKKKSPIAEGKTASSITSYLPEKDARQESLMFGQNSKETGGRSRSCIFLGGGGEPTREGGGGKQETNNISLGEKKTSLGDRDPPAT